MLSRSLELYLFSFIISVISTFIIHYIHSAGCSLISIGQLSNRQYKPNNAPKARPASPFLALPMAAIAEKMSGAPLPKARKVTPCTQVKEHQMRSNTCTCTCYHCTSSIFTTILFFWFFSLKKYPTLFFGSDTLGFVIYRVPQVMTFV